MYIYNKIYRETARARERERGTHSAVSQSASVRLSSRSRSMSVTPGSSSVMARICARAFTGAMSTFAGRNA